MLIGTSGRPKKVNERLLYKLIKSRNFKITSQGGTSSLSLSCSLCLCESSRARFTYMKAQGKFVTFDSIYLYDCACNYSLVCEDMRPCRCSLHVKVTSVGAVQRWDLSELNQLRKMHDYALMLRSKT